MVPSVVELFPSVSIPLLSSPPVPLSAPEGAEDKDGVSQDTVDKDGATDGAENKDGVEGTENKDDATTDGTEGVEGETTQEPENAFINKDGEEVLPSTLIGVDYNTVAGSYDGETNVLKQYAGLCYTEFRSYAINIKVEIITVRMRSINCCICYF